MEKRLLEQFKLDKKAVAAGEMSEQSFSDIWSEIFALEEAERNHEFVGALEEEYTAEI